MLTVATHKKLVKLAEAHQQADEYISGSYDNWPRGACAIGCTIKDAKQLGLLPKNVRPENHKSLEKLGVPEMVWRLADNIFEGLPESIRPAWTPRLLKAIKPGADYSRVPARIMYRLSLRLARDASRDDVKEAAKAVSALWKRRADGDEPVKSEWEAVEKQAYAARRQAYAAWQQAYAARRQAYAAWQQAYAARQQADAAWRQADAARQQADAARQQFWEWCADVVIECMEQAA